MSHIKTVTYVEFGGSGHRLIWIRSVVQAFAARRSGWRMCIWLPRDCFNQHSNFIQKLIAFKGSPQADVGFHAHEELVPDPKAISKFTMIKKCIREDNADVCFIALELDSCLKEIAFGRHRDLQCKLVGVLKSPILHYLTFRAPGRRKGLKLKTFIREYLLNFFVCRRMFLGGILTLDPFAPSIYRWLMLSKKYNFLPSDYLVTNSLMDVHTLFSIPRDRDILLFTGTIDLRKGIFEFLAGVKYAFQNSKKFQKTTIIVIAGQVSPHISAELTSKLKMLKKEFPSATIQLFDRFLSDNEYVTLVAASSVVCLPYVKFAGMSGVLVHAVNYGRVVLTSRFGLIGELVDRYALGYTCNESDPVDLAAALERSLEKARNRSRSEIQICRKSAKRFSCFLDEFGERICDKLFKVGGKEAA